MAKVHKFGLANSLLDSPMATWLTVTGTLQYSSLFVLFPLLCPYFHFYVRSIFDAPSCGTVVHSSVASPFSLISSLTLSNQLLLGLPLFLLPCTFVSIALLPT